jgi:uncharacterized PurR-regulated membrane protein YhhQ (DUF165 family)
MLVSQYLVKVLIEAVAGTPLAYLLVNWARNEDGYILRDTSSSL